MHIVLILALVVVLTLALVILYGFWKSSHARNEFEAHMGCSAVFYCGILVLDLVRALGLV